jgi:hypothetical protein
MDEPFQQESGQYYILDVSRAIDCATIFFRLSYGCPLVSFALLYLSYCY